MARTLKAMLVASLMFPVAASAQATIEEYNEYEVEVEDEGGGDIVAPSYGLMGAVGVGDYNLDLNNEVNAGVGYGAIVDLSPVRNIGLEIGYQGAVNNLDDDISEDGRLITNQVGGNLRVNIVPPRQDLVANLRPFVFGGAFYHRIDTDNFTPGIQDDVNAFALPVGGGLEAEIGDRFLVGGRFTYNFLFNEVDALGGDSDWWLASVNLGTRIGG